EGIGAAVIQASGPIDVHMVTHDEARRGVRWMVDRTPLGRSRRITGWAMAVLLPALCALVGVLFKDAIELSTALAGFLLATVVVALSGGLGPALFAAFLGAGLLNFFFTVPYHSLVVAAPENVVSLIAMVVVAVLVALVVDRAARLGEQGARARTEAALLASYARAVLGPQPLERLLTKVRENFGLESVALLERHDSGWDRVAWVGPRPCDAPDDADVDVPVIADVHLALRGRTLSAADQGVLEAAAGQSLMALRQQRMATETAEAQRKAATTELRTALLSAVGHDLRTPLTSIKAAIGSLRDPGLRLPDRDVAELMATVEESTDRLTGLVDNLLDSSRLVTGAVAARLRPVGYDEVVAAALSGIDERHLVAVDVDERLPRVLADIGLLERAVANVIDNALRHGRLRPRRPDGDGRVLVDEPEIAVRASAYGDHVELRVVDHGPGLHRRARDSVFTPFQRFDDRAATTGLGLGLSVAKGFVDAMGGTIAAEDTPGGGLTIVIALPVHQESAA
ncbi:MAG: DUF4118 domain-containing protein, partial [Saccharothrix sp.]|nr:DUF4118 domain-containing protein [Saccharothrix sp.]